MPNPKKLIEVALPLPEINDASAYDKMPGIGPHPKGIHHWWARLPLPTARAVLFASVVDDPSEHPERFATEEDQNKERERLFDIVRRMMQKKLHERPSVYNEARDEMVRHSAGRLPPLFDPFAGGASIPIEASRLGLESHAGDLNPVAVLLAKCSLELAPRWINRPPINPEDRRSIRGINGWRGTQGLAADIRHYGQIIRERARANIHSLYPRMPLTKNQVGGEANIIAWIWARTVASPNPSTHGRHVPLISTYWLSNKKGAEVWLEPTVNKKSGEYTFAVRYERPKDRSVVARGTKNKGGFKCLLTDDPIPFGYIRREGQNGRLGSTLLAIVAERSRGRLYLPQSEDQLQIAMSATPSGYPDTDLPEEALGFRVQNYGIRKHWQMFTARQLTAIVRFSDLVKEIDSQVYSDGIAAGLNEAEATCYSQATTTFLALGLDRCVDFNNSLCGWSSSNQKVMHLFGRAAIPMVWDFAEANILGDSVGSWSTCIEYVADCVEVLTTGVPVSGEARQIDAATNTTELPGLLISTDPPYYDNIGYAALSDVFYIWLRRTIGSFYPDLFSTVLVPKVPELTASPELFGGDDKKAKEHFESGFRRAFSALRLKMDQRFPLTVYYAFKQEDEDSETNGDAEKEDAEVDLTTGWETLLEALVSSGFQITATWPVRASQQWRMRAMSSNALASYIVLACRPREPDAQQIDRRSFIVELKRELPAALRHLQQGNIAPVDFAQAAIGPGMAVYSRYSRILESKGTHMTVRTALSLINQTLTEVLSEQEDEFDSDTRWALAWFEQSGFTAGDFGDAELLSKAKVTSVGGLQQAGLVISKGGDVRLLRPDEFPKDWDPEEDRRLTVWEMTHHLLRVYYLEKAGDHATAELLRKMGTAGEIARDLAYRLFNVCEKKKWSQEAQAYNALVLGWPEIARLAREMPQSEPKQTSLL